MLVIGFALMVLIGISLGLIGSGGSILTIPILVYLFGLSPDQAAVYSLFIVAVSAAVGSVQGLKNKLIDKKMLLYFGLPSVLGIFAMRKFFMPILPDILWKIGDWEVSKNFVIMIVFAVLMILAAIAMIRTKKVENAENQAIDYKKIILKGGFIGILTGFVGVGGGFLIIPALVFSAGLGMKNAVATSLAIIAINALIGFGGSLGATELDWILLSQLSGLAIIGILIGQFLSKKISNEKLKPAFGWFVLLMGIYIFIKESFNF